MSGVDQKLIAEMDSMTKDELITFIMEVVCPNGEADELKIKMLQSENKALRKALPVLKFYGDKENWEEAYYGEPCMVQNDDGHCARQAYKEITEELEKLK